MPPRRRVIRPAGIPASQGRLTPHARLTTWIGDFRDRADAKRWADSIADAARS